WVAPHGSPVTNCPAVRSSSARTGRPSTQRLGRHSSSTTPGCSSHRQGPRPSRCPHLTCAGIATSALSIRVEPRRHQQYVGGAQRCPPTHGRYRHARPPARCRIGRPRLQRPASFSFLEPVMARTRKKRRREVKRVPRSDATLPEFDRRACPEDLLTRRQLRERGLSPGGHSPVAVLRCKACAYRPDQSCTHPTRAWLYRDRKST